MCAFGAGPGRKGSRDRTTPLTARVLALLDRRRAKAPKSSTGPFDKLTPRRAQHIFTFGKQRTSLASVEDAVIHSFRHTCATRLLELTGDIKLVQDWLGHTNLQTTSSIYAKVMTGSKLRGAAALEAFERQTRQVTDHSPFQDRNDSETGGRFNVRH